MLKTNEDIALQIFSYYYYTVRSDDVKVLKSMTPGNNINTLLITFIAFNSFISSKFQTLFFPYKLSYYTLGPTVIKFENLVEICFWLNLAVKGLRKSFSQYR